MPLIRATLDELTIEDEDSFSHVGLYADLKALARREGVRFLVPADGTISWDRALFLNLAFWAPGSADVLTDRVIPADVVMHVAWHHLASKHLSPSREADVLGEAVASAFDLYLVGRLLGIKAEAAFLETQVPRMAEVCESAGMADSVFEAMLDEVARAPERAFEDLRALLFDATLALADAPDASRADEILAAFDDRRFAPLLFHYEIANWVVAARTRSPEAKGEDAIALDRRLRAADDAVAELTNAWVLPVGCAGGKSGEP